MGRRCRGVISLLVAQSFIMIKLCATSRLDLGTDVVSGSRSSFSFWFCVLLFKGLLQKEEQSSSPEEEEDV